MLSEVLPSALIGLGVGTAIGLLSLGNTNLAKENRRHRDVRVLENYDGELAQILTDVSVMKDTYSEHFFGLVKSLTDLLRLSNRLDTIANDPDVAIASITFAATQYQHQVQEHAGELLEHVHEFERHAALLKKNIGVIQEVAKTVAEECANRCLDASMHGTSSATLSATFTQDAQDGAQIAQEDQEFQNAQEAQEFQNAQHARPDAEEVNAGPDVD